jgi:hypothetical protein
MSNLARNLTFNIPQISSSQTTLNLVPGLEVLPDNIEDVEVRGNLKATEIISGHISESEVDDFELKINKSEVLDGEFYCIIDSVDYVDKEVSARVYDMKNKVQVMTITANFDEFLESEQNKIVSNAMFYWRMGSRTLMTTSKKSKTFNQTKLFSEFRMRLNYVSSRALETRLQSRVDKFSNLFV